MGVSTNEFSMSTASENNNTTSNSQHNTPNKSVPAQGAISTSTKNFISATSQLSIYDNTLQMMMSNQQRQLQNKNAKPE